MVTPLLLLLAASDGGHPPAPPGLACLTKYYLGTPVHLDAGWAWEIADGGTLPWDDGRPHAAAGDPEENDTVEEPNLRSVYEPPYVPGPIVPVNGEGEIEDPGRVRVEQLFLSTYGSSRDDVKDHLGHIRFFGTRYRFHERAVGPMERVIARLQAAVKENPKLSVFLTDIGGTWQWRTIARSKNLSAHAWGIAIDLNVERGYYWRWQRPKLPLKWRNKVPQVVVDAFEAEGFIWGGRWLHYDTMHFEYRPELLDPACQEPKKPAVDAGSP